MIKTHDLLASLMEVVLIVSNETDIDLEIEGAYATSEESFLVVLSNKQVFRVSVKEEKAGE